MEPTGHPHPLSVSENKTPSPLLLDNFCYLRLLPLGWIGGTWACLAFTWFITE